MEQSKKNKIKQILYSVVGLLIIAYFVYQIFAFNSEPYKTEFAFTKQIQQTIKTTGFVVRDESYIVASDIGGTPVSVAEDGKKVSSGDAVAVSFSTNESAAAYVKSNEIKKEIAYCKQLQNRVGVGTNAPSTYNDLIDKTCLNFINASKDGIGGDYYSKLIDFRDAVTARKLAVGEKISVDEKLASLQAELDSLEALSSTYSVITSPNSGYYIGAVDGYEEAFPYDDVLNVNCEKINELIESPKKEISKNVMGKLVDEFNWYILCVVPYNMSGDIEEGKNVSINILNTAVSGMKCSVAYKGNREGDSVPVVLKCNIMNRNVANIRIGEIEIITKEYDGIRIDNKAIREVDGQKGVFVEKGNIIQFKKIDIVDSNENNSIISIVDDWAYVKQYDKIITEGVDLYDGKIISR